MLFDMHVGTRDLVQVGRDGGPTEHKDAFMRAFDACRANGRNVLVVNDGGSLQYKFRGCAEREPVLCIGVPLHDTVFYISELGRVAMTGSGAAALVTRGGFVPGPLAAA